MPQISGMVMEGQDPETRIDQVITSASWIPQDDMFLVQQGKDEILTNIVNQEWAPPFEWSIVWVNIPAQEAQQSVTTGIISSGGLA